MSLLKRLQNWYRNQCDGDWEHTYGISVSTLDNPGWRVEVDLKETSLETKLFKEIRDERTEHDWIHAWITDSVFNLACGPQNLDEALTIFCDWAES